MPELKVTGDADTKLHVRVSSTCQTISDHDSTVVLSFVFSVNVDVYRWVLEKNKVIELLSKTSTNTFGGNKHVTNSIIQDSMFLATTWSRSTEGTAVVSEFKSVVLESADGIVMNFIDHYRKANPDTLTME